MTGIVSLGPAISKDWSMTTLISGLMMSLAVIIVNIMVFHRLSLLLIVLSRKWQTPSRLGTSPLTGSSASRVPV
jgi:hypothetical protein